MTKRQVYEAVERMTREELIRLWEYIAALIDEKEQGEAPEKQRGHIELKMIGKWGPYAYLRYWQDGKLHSKYLGKVMV